MIKLSGKEIKTMKKTAGTVNMMMEMYMCCMCMTFCVAFSDLFSISAADRFAA